jgi:hypothetical protein
MSTIRSGKWLSAALGGAALLAAGCAADTQNSDTGSAGEPTAQEGPNGSASWGGAGPGGDYANPASDDGFPEQFGDAVDNNPGIDDPIDDPNDPTDPDDPIGPAGDAVLGILANTPLGRELLILDEVGTLVETITLTNPNVSDIAWHPDGFFVGTDGASLVQIELDGQTNLIAPLYGFVYRVNVPDDGAIDTAEESTVSSYDLQGNLIDSLGAPGACYMDMGVDSNGTSLALDVWNYKVVEWTGAGFADVVTGLPSGVGILGRDDSDTIWVSSGYGAELLVQTGTTATSLGSMTDLGQPADSVQAIEAADANSVYVLSDSWSSGSALSVVTQDGDLIPLANTTTDMWMDMVRID